MLGRSPQINVFFRAVTHVPSSTTDVNEGLWSRSASVQRHLHKEKKKTYILNDPTYVTMISGVKDIIIHVKKTVVALF